jgi:hypothetical protein
MREREREKEGEGREGRVQGGPFQIFLREGSRREESEEKWNEVEEDSSDQFG